MMPTLNALIVVVLTAELAACGSAGAPVASAYVWTAHCYTQDYISSGTGQCVGHMWH